MVRKGSWGRCLQRVSTVWVRFGVGESCFFPHGMIIQKPFVVKSHNLLFNRTHYGSRKAVVDGPSPPEVGVGRGSARVWGQGNGVLLIYVWTPMKSRPHFQLSFHISGFWFTMNTEHFTHSCQKDSYRTLRIYDIFIMYRTITLNACRPY